MEGLFAPFPTKVGPIYRGFYSQRKAFGFADIRDGSSNTIAIGESSRSENSRVGFVPHRAGWAFGAHAETLSVNGKPVYFPIELYAIRCIGNDPINTNRNYLDEVDQRNGHCFNSNHPGGAQFAMADGSVEFVSESVEIQILLALGSIASGEAVADY
jgi:prepilin-type processing-associated H-X9-DG protein